MIRPATTATRARACVLEAHSLAATIDAALDDTDLAGYPTRSAGAGDTGTATVELACDQCGEPQPCRTHRLDLTSDPGDKHELGHLSTKNTSLTESTALTGDRARQDLEALHEHVRLAIHHLRRAAKISVARGTIRLNEKAVTNRIHEATKEIWCENCTKIGQRNIRLTGSELCEFCDDHRKKWKRPPSKRIWECRNARGGSIYPNDIQRIYREEALEADRKKDEQKREAKSHRKAS